MKNRRNYYRILHVQPDAPREVIRSSYRTIMHKMRTHPDLGGDEANAALVNEAYSVLSNETERASYDQLRQSADWSRSAANDPPLGELVLGAAQQTACAFCAAPVAEAHDDQGLTGFCPGCDSPLAPVADIVMEDSDRRAIARIPKQLGIAFCTHWPQLSPHSGIANDISLTGMRFGTEVFMARDQIVKIDSAALKAVARVVRCQPLASRWEVGVHFLNLCFARAKGSFVHERV